MKKISEWKRREEATEQARKDVERKITEKTGHTCIAYTSNYRHEETKYIIQCITIEGFKTVTALFTDDPFYQEEVRLNLPGIPKQYILNCDIDFDGFLLKTTVLLNYNEYKKWLGVEENGFRA